MVKNNELLKKEHEAVRNKVGFFDFAHDILEVTGKDARDFLDYMCVNVISELKPKSASYTTILNENADALDDVIVFYHGGDKYWVTTLFMDSLQKWFNSHVKDRNVKFEDITKEKALYAVQGPNSKQVINKMLKDSVDDLGYFEFKETMLDDINVMVSRTGFTGELGYELYFHPKYTEQIVKALKDKGEEFGIREITTNVTLTSLPTEKGYITVNDFKGANPIELGLEWSVDCEKDFVGKEKLCVLKEEGPERRLVGFEVEGDNIEIKKGDIVKVDGKEIGNVTTFTYGFTVDMYIGYALIESQYAKEGDKLTIVNGNKEIEANIVEGRIFYDLKGERVRA